MSVAIQYRKERLAQLCGTLHVTSDENGIAVLATIPIRPEASWYSQAGFCAMCEAQGTAEFLCLHTNRNSLLWLDATCLLSPPVLGTLVQKYGKRRRCGLRSRSPTCVQN